MPNAVDAGGFHLFVINDVKEHLCGGNVPALNVLLWYVKSHTTISRPDNLRTSAAKKFISKLYVLNSPCHIHPAHPKHQPTKIKMKSWAILCFLIYRIGSKLCKYQWYSMLCFVSAWFFISHFYLFSVIHQVFHMIFIQFTLCVFGSFWWEMRKSVVKNVQSVSFTLPWRAVK